ncbi:hypothetical protein LCGC14_2800520, partial [marine sediment metagenome]
GTMSLVGPRPLYERQAAQRKGHQPRRVDVRPGITGYAQVFGRAALTHEDKIDLDVYSCCFTTTMAELVANLLEREAGIGQMPGASMPEAMCPSCR